MRVFTCPSCGASLDIDDTNRDFAFCQYCGNKIMLDDYRSTHRIVDEARLMEAENHRMVLLREYGREDNAQQQIEAERLRNSEIEAHYRELRKKALIIWLAVSIPLLLIGLAIPVLILVGLAAFLIGLWIVFVRIPQRRIRDLGGIKLPGGASDLTGQTIEAAESAFRTAGFKNITLTSLHDVKLGLLQKEGRVSSVTVNGKEVTIGGRYYMPDANVVITYHGR